MWEQLRDKLPSSKSKNVLANLCDICLKCQLIGWALELTMSIPDDTIGSERGVAAMLAPVYKREALNVATVTGHATLVNYVSSF